MKLNARNRPTLIRLTLLGILTGSLAWGLLEALLRLFGFSLSLELGPVGFDLYILSLWLRINPGSLFGLIGGMLLFRSL